MKISRFLIAVIAVCLAGSAWAHPPRARVGVGVVIGAPVVYSPWWYPPPWYYYPPTPVIVTPPPPPPVYIEQSVAPAEPAAGDYWYYCTEASAYYPNVKECPGGWQRVLPRAQ
ncbi:MAG: hypothetical protein LWW83_15725 [Azonexaceae bacterium]|uniref:hypothetical protein n=1 Tax=Azonexus sp. R2A61 TaxID=2744443 RepID=UPI001F1D861C|nr:hypothetical protein [Azonexus sp. R2A61]MCE1241365.1 hypothetical protein [Azonexaceae bacterium]